MDFGFIKSGAISSKKNKYKIHSGIWSGIEGVGLNRQVMASPPTTTFGTTPTIANPVVCPAATSAGSLGATTLSQDKFTYTRAGGVLKYNGIYIKMSSTTLNNTPTYGSSLFSTSFFYTGSELEIGTGVSGSLLFVKIDDEFISLTPDSPTSSAMHYKYINFGSRKNRRIEILFVSGSFRGIFLPPTESIMPAEIRGPRCIIMGDSHTLGTGASLAGIGGYATLLGEYLGWDDLWQSAIGGTGYLNNATTKNTFRQRFAHDVLPFNPDILIIAGGANDATAYTKEQIKAEAKLLYSDIKAGLPDTKVIVVSPYLSDGSNFVASGFINAYEAIKEAASEHSLDFIDLVEMPLNQAPYATTLSANVSIGGTSFIAPIPLPEYGFYEIGAERVQISTVTGSGTGPYTHNLVAGQTFASSHVSGDAITQAGASFWTGNGRVGSTLGYGNCDIYVSSDGVHFSDAGHAALAAYLYLEIKKILIGLSFYSY